MPSRPSAARRQFHTRRVIAKRIAQARAFHACGWWPPTEIMWGRLDNEQVYHSCHCGLCRPRIDHGEERRQAERRWRKAEDLAGDASGWRVQAAALARESSTSQPA
jgi:hypothetical protein